MSELMGIPPWVWVPIVSILVVLGVLAGIIRWSYVLLPQGWSDDDHPTLDPATQRINLTAVEILALPVRHVTPGELYEVMCQVDYNGVEAYPNGVTPLPGECGHDRSHRYVDATARRAPEQSSAAKADAVIEAITEEEREAAERSARSHMNRS